MNSNRKNVIVITSKDPYSIKEILTLVESLDYNVAKIITQKRLGYGKYGIGYGKLLELKEWLKNNKVDFIIFDEKLSVSKTYNLAKVTQILVMDRERLILNIFNERAFTEEAKLQVKLAELKYEIPRAREKVRLAKLGEQPGFYGLGKYEVDVYFRDLKRRISIITKKLKKVSKRRNLYRERRESLGLRTLALAGYTGSGKTTLFNLLAKEYKDTHRGVFTTLSPVTRSIMINAKKVLLLDTVGFIERLPPYMIEAFKSTLEELIYSNLILLLIDISEDNSVIMRKYKTCQEILNELNVSNSKILLVFNKADLLPKEELELKVKLLRKYEPRVIISAKSGFGLGTLMEELEKRLIGEKILEEIKDRSP
ncbi:MAG: GTPase HflX [Nitrososphaerales archaeon]